MYYTNNRLNEVCIFEYLRIGACTIEEATNALQATENAVKEAAAALNLTPAGRPVIRYNGHDYAVVLRTSTDDEREAKRQARAAGIKESKSQSF